MRKKTIRQSIFASQLIIIIFFFFLVTTVFNVAAKANIRKQTFNHLFKIGNNIKKSMSRDLPNISIDLKNEDAFIRYYMRINRSLGPTLSVLNAEYAFLDGKQDIIYPTTKLFGDIEVFKSNIVDKSIQSIKISKSNKSTFSDSGLQYAAVLVPVGSKNDLGISYILIYSSIENIKIFQSSVNIILIFIVVITGIIAIIISIYTSKNISKPIMLLCEHVSNIGNRNFNARVSVKGSSEIVELSNNIDTMTDKLRDYDNAHRTFLQNASHELRTPLMSIQSYAEGIKYNVLENNDSAIDIIIDESKRLTSLVEELLYLSRVDYIDEYYNMESMPLVDLIYGCVERINSIAIKQGIEICCNISNTNVMLQADEEKLSRALINVLSNCIRFAKSKVSITCTTTDNAVNIIICDDGDGFSMDELHHIFDRFYRGKNGNFGLGLTIAKSIIERHNGQITAQNTENGAQFNINLKQKAL